MWALWPQTNTVDHLCNIVMSQPEIALNLNQHDPLKPEFTIIIFIHYKPRIAVAILDS